MLGSILIGLGLLLIVLAACLNLYDDKDKHGNELFALFLVGTSFIAGSLSGIGSYLIFKTINPDMPLLYIKLISTLIGIGIGAAFFIFTITQEN